MNHIKNQMNAIILIVLLLSSSILIMTPKISSESSTQVDLLIISPSSFVDSLQPLAMHKNNNSISNRIVTVDQIFSGDWPLSNVSSGRDNAETIKLFISETVKQWNTQYVLLVGGKEQVPVRYARIDMNDSSQMNPFLFPGSSFGLPSILQMMDCYISDLYYADLFFDNGSFCSWDSNQNMRFAEKNVTQQIDIVDLKPDVAVGRLLCTSAEEVETVVNKIITYESRQHVDVAWEKNLTVCGGDTHSLWRDVLIKLALFNRSDVKIAWEGEYMGDVVADILSSCRVKKVYTTKTSMENRMMVSRENINHAINNGCKFLFMAGHGYPEAWGTHPPSVFGKIWLPGPIFDPLLYRSEDILDLTNNDKLPVAVISACSCGDFNQTEDPFAWTFVEHEKGGAIATFACSTLGTLLPTTLSEKTLNGKLSLGVFQAYDDGVKRVGDMWRESIISYVEDDEAMKLGSLGGMFWLNQFNVEEWILFGDPTLTVR